MWGVIMKGPVISLRKRLQTASAISLIFLPLLLKAETLTLNSQPVGEIIGYISDQTGRDIFISDEAMQVPLSGVFNFDTPDQLIADFDELLRVNKLTVTADDDRIVIVPDADFVPVEEQIVYQSVELANYSPVEFIEQYKGLFDDVGVQPVGSNLYISGFPKDVNRVAEMIGRADLDQKQLLIEVTILEVLKSASEDFDFKLQHAFADSGFTFINSGGAELSDIGASLTYLSGGSLSSFINLVSTFDDVDIVSASKLLVQNDRDAYIAVGENVPFLSSVETIESGSRVNNIVRKDVGLSLSIHPLIIGDDVRLSVNQELSSVSPSTVASDIITNQRTIETAVTVATGRSIFIGGLASTNTQKSKSKPLLLSRVPILGKALTGKSNSTLNRDMRLMIKVTILED
jgi:general secretion pathway protein D